jgi:quinol monooxygenase YgiN
MATALIRHRVRDYDAWRKVYDSFAEFQAAGGVIEKAVYRTPADPNDVLVLHRFPTQRQAEDFVASTELRNAMQEAGVEGPPQIDIYDEAD